MPATYEIHYPKDLEKAFQNAKALQEKVPVLWVAYSSQPFSITEESTRSLSQNALFHVWITEACKYHYTTAKPEKADIEGMKRWMKLGCYTDTKQRWLLTFARNPENDEVKVDYVSSGKWNVGQAHHVMEWMLQFWAEKGLVLEVKGQFQELSEKQNG